MFHCFFGQSKGYAYLSLHEVGEAAHGERRAVGLAHEEPLEDDGIELALGPPHQETVELHSRSNTIIIRQHHTFTYTKG